MTRKNSVSSVQTSSFKDYIIYLFYVCVLSACVFVQHLCAWYPQRPAEGIRSAGTGVTDYYEPLCGCWEPDPVTVSLAA